MSADKSAVGDWVESCLSDSLTRTKYEQGYTIVVRGGRPPCVDVRVNLNRIPDEDATRDNYKHSFTPFSPEDISDDLKKFLQQLTQSVTGLQEFQFEEYQQDLPLSETYTFRAYYYPPA